jgi:asparagine synthase (glutamine-hydrolysing)
MCGITGIVDLTGKSVNIEMVNRMVEAMAHRGPDDEGYLFVNTKNGNMAIAGGEATPRNVYSAGPSYTPQVDCKKITGRAYNLFFASRRLAIFDLSPAGHQPMSNEEGTVWITYNGAIYNYMELKEELILKGYAFTSDSDTEVIIKAYLEWGTECLSRFNGMWAFCIWDRRKKRVFCARDRFGIKPFYYYFDGSVFAFASEIKSLLTLGISREPNDALIYDYLRWGMLDHTNETFFKRVHKLPISNYMVLDLKGDLKMQRYWNLEVSDEIESKYSDESYAEEFLRLFTDAVRLRLRSDVPIGSCLSGGLDSSSVVSVANSLMFTNENSSASKRQKTFSSCFEDRRFDEREYIEEVIRKTQAEKNYVFPSPDEFSRDLDTLLWHQEEPFGGTSIYAQWLVLKKARKSAVTVMLDGQGGDEQLSGYRKFYLLYLVELLKSRKYEKLFWESFKFFSSIEILKTLNFKAGLRYFNMGEKLLRVDDLFGEDFKQRFKDRELKFGYHRSLGHRIKEDLFRFSLPVLLRYEDRNSMAHSVETRLPFLDYRLVEKLASFPLTQKMQNGWTKYVLRNAMKGILNEKVRLRKSKLGFATPEDYWFKKSLLAMVKDVFQNSIFLPHYVAIKTLLGFFDQYSAGISLYQSQFFFRFFILELWAHKFFSSP